MLASLSADWRVSAEQRKRAQQLLDDMTPARIVTAGLFADYTAECSRFFRQFETTDHDVALSSAHKQAFLKRVKALFVDGFVIADVPAVCDTPSTTPLSAPANSTPPLLKLLETEQPSMVFGNIPLAVLIL